MGVFQRSLLILLIQTALCFVTTAISGVMIVLFDKYNEIIIKIIITTNVIEIVIITVAIYSYKVKSINLDSVTIKNRISINLRRQSEYSTGPTVNTAINKNDINQGQNSFVRRIEMSSIDDERWSEWCSKVFGSHVTSPIIDFTFDIKIILIILLLICSQIISAGVFLVWPGKYRTFYLVAFNSLMPWGLLLIHYKTLTDYYENCDPLLQFSRSKIIQKESELYDDYCKAINMLPSYFTNWYCLNTSGRIINMKDFNSDGEINLKFSKQIVKFNLLMIRTIVSNHYDLHGGNIVISGLNSGIVDLDNIVLILNNKKVMIRNDIKDNYNMINSNYEMEFINNLNFKILIR